MAVIRALPDPGGVAKVVNPPLPGAPKVEPLKYVTIEVRYCDNLDKYYRVIFLTGPPLKMSLDWPSP